MEGESKKRTARRGVPPFSHEHPFGCEVLKRANCPTGQGAYFGMDAEIGCESGPQERQPDVAARVAVTPLASSTRIEPSKKCSEFLTGAFQGNVSVKSESLPPANRLMFICQPSVAIIMGFG